MEAENKGIRNLALMHNKSLREDEKMRASSMQSFSLPAGQEQSKRRGEKTGV